MRIVNEGISIGKDLDLIGSVLENEPPLPGGLDEKDESCDPGLDCCVA